MPARGGRSPVASAHSTWQATMSASAPPHRLTRVCTPGRAGGVGGTRPGWAGRPLACPGPGHPRLQRGRRESEVVRRPHRDRHRGGQSSALPRVRTRPRNAPRSSGGDGRALVESRRDPLRDPPGMIDAPRRRAGRAVRRPPVVRPRPHRGVPAARACPPKLVAGSPAELARLAAVADAVRAVRASLEDGLPRRCDDRVRAGERDPIQDRHQGDLAAALEEGANLRGGRLIADTHSRRPRSRSVAAGVFSCP